MITMIAVDRAQFVERRVHCNDRKRKVAFCIASEMFHPEILHYFK